MTEIESDARADWMATLARWGRPLTGAVGALIVVGAAALYLATINRFTDSYDEGVYWQSLWAMAHGHALFASIFSSQAPYFLVSLYPFFTLFGQTLAAARIGIAVFALVGVLAMYWLGSELAGVWTGLLAAALLAIAPYYLDQARALEADGPAVAVSILAVALAVAAMRREGRARRALAALSGAALVYGMLIKLYDVVAIIPIVLYLLEPVFRAFDAGDGRPRWPGMGTLLDGLRRAAPDLVTALGGAVAVAAALMAPFLGDLSALWSQAVAFHLTALGGLTASISNQRRAIGSRFEFYAALIVITVVAAIWRRVWRVAPAALWLLASLILIVRLNPFFDHYATLVAPGFALLAALAPALLKPLLERRGAGWGAVVVTLAALAVLAVTLAGVARQTGSSLRAGISTSNQDKLDALQAFTTPGEVIVTDDQYLAATSGHTVPPELVDTSIVRIRTGYLTTAQVESIIERDHIRVVFLATGRLDSMPGFMPWLTTEFRPAAREGDGGNGNGYTVYIRVPSGSTVA